MKRIAVSGIMLTLLLSGIVAGASGSVATSETGFFLQEVAIGDQKAQVEIGVAANDYWNTNETDELHNTLTEFGFSYTDVDNITDAINAGCDLIIAYHGSVAIDWPRSDVNDWLNTGKGFIHISDWPTWFYPDPFVSITEHSWVNISLVSPHPITNGLPFAWVGTGFWYYGFQPADYIGWVDNATKPNLAGANGYNRAVTAEEVGPGRAVYLGFNVFGYAAGANSKQLFENAILWVAQPEPIFQYHFRIDPFSNVIHLNTNPGGWLNGYMTGGPIGWNPVLGKYEAGRFYMAIDVYPDAEPGYYEMLFLVGTVATRTGQLIMTVDGMSYNGPINVNLVTTAQSEAQLRLDVAEVFSSKVKPAAWYTFKLNPYADIVHLNTNPGGWLNGYDDIYEPDAPVLGFAEAGRFYFAADGIFPPNGPTMFFMAGTVATRDGEVIITADGTTYTGPVYTWLTPA